MLEHYIKPLNAELNFICHFLALFGANHITHVSRIRVKIVYERFPLLPFQSSFQHYLTFYVP